ncbi:MAG: NUDIX hydrolase [Phycisphaerae bacterium]|nr:NUDIX hydrolase [Phycisphaerae bacterium]
MSRKILNNTLVHRSYLFEVRRLRLQLPDGREIDRDLVKHPGAALVLPVLEDGSIVMIRNYRYAAAGYLWELPCGTLEDGEEPEACAVRELTEESGYTAGRIEKLGQFYSCPGYNDEIIHAFLATDLTKGEQNLEGYEDISVEIRSDTQVRRMAADNEITDGKTLATLSMYWMKTQT